MDHKWSTTAKRQQSHEIGNCARGNAERSSAGLAEDYDVQRPQCVRPLIRKTFYSYKRLVAFNCIQIESIDILLDASARVQSIGGARNLVNLGALRKSGGIRESPSQSTVLCHMCLSV